jgi:hypothetical protein
MFNKCVKTGIRKSHLRYTVSWIVAAILTLQSVIAADAWSRVTRLKVGKDLVYIALTSGEHEKGRFLGADVAGITIRTIGQRDITIARDLVLQAGIEIKQNRRWFSIPLAAVAAVIGALAGYKITRHFKCSNKAGGEHKACEQVGFLILIGSAIVPAGAAYALASLDQSKKGIKVIYDKPSALIPDEKSATAVNATTLR